ncbi:LysE family translocator [Microbulbifer sp. THAF38]|uniref:LysE family translocator n=1 Tax=Microbulbifer sp. THAF38 TaxID=2587856 RepID=UPI001267A84F|nr:LysE family translocator [Microbulbifer sp. THAF38]QFT55728.1 Cysteine/O-acetylserine efflux protein [Microbulbifer sp. THAF38]
MSLFLAMFGFSLTMSITPGPVNMVIVSSGVQHGFARTIPFVSGATIGFTLLLAAIGFGFYQILESYPQLLHYLAIAGSLYVIYMGYKIASAPAEEIAIDERSLPRFHEGFLLQWLNPKAWIACVSGVALFSSPHSQLSLVYFVFVYFWVCYASLTLWAFAGDKIRHLLGGTSRIKRFNLVMGGLLILCAVYLLYSHFLPGQQAL